MADIAIFRINYKSDFILTLNSDAGWLTPFCIKFWTGAPSQAYYAYYDGMSYTHCAPVEGEPTKLLVQFDDHHLPIGDLQFQIGYHFTVADFPTSIEDEVINQASVIIEVDDAPAQVMLDLNGETAPEIQFSLPAYANEAQRIANEEQRIAHEAIRIVNEESRIAAETIRQQNEAQRISNEESRVAEFASLKHESETATADANAAATLANEKAQLAADKAALADDAATLANAKAQLAADKAALADAAATLANDKAALAQQKAEYAQTQGDYAKAQGDYAKQQGEIAEEDHERAESDHTRAESDHATAGSDHTQAGTDHTRAENDHTTASADHTQAGQDHTRAESDHSQATSDHTQAGTDHTRAESDHATASADHTQAGQDHTRAESDHTRAESDHAAVEVYVDSLGAFDISAYHATGGVLAKYADLTAALGTNGANIPEALRKGGMSVKYAQSSDNKYVQYRLMAQNFTTDTTQWQGVDSEPTAGSENLVKSGGVANNIIPLQHKIDGINIEKSFNITSTPGYYSIGNYALYEGEAVTLHLSGTSNITRFWIENENHTRLKDYIVHQTGGEETVSFTVSEDSINLQVCVVTVTAAGTLNLTLQSNSIYEDLGNVEQKVDLLIENEQIINFSEDVDKTSDVYAVRLNNLDISQGDVFATKINTNIVVSRIIFFAKNNSGVEYRAYDKYNPNINDCIIVNPSDSIASLSIYIYSSNVGTQPINVILYKNSLVDLITNSTNVPDLTNSVFGEHKSGSITISQSGIVALCNVSIKKGYRYQIKLSSTSSWTRLAIFSQGAWPGDDSHEIKNRELHQFVAYSDITAIQAFCISAPSYPIVIDYTIDVISISDVSNVYPEISLPDKLYVLNGKQNSIYYKNIFNWLSDNFVISQTGSAWNYLERCVRNFGSPAGLNIDLLDKHSLLPTIKTAGGATIVSNASTNNGAKKINVIGDSYTYNGTWYQHIYDICPALSFVGMRKSYSVGPTLRAEGRGGWTLKAYLTIDGSSSPVDGFSPFIHPSGFKYYGPTEFWSRIVNNNIGDDGYTLNGFDDFITWFDSNGKKQNPQTNDMMYDSVNNTYIYYNGSAWVNYIGTPTFEFNYETYLATWNIQTPDFILIMLGVNDFYSNYTNEIAAGFVQDYNTILDNITAYATNNNLTIKIGICTNTVIASLPNRIGNNNLYNPILNSRCLWKGRKCIIDTFNKSSYENRGIFVVDTGATLDPDYGFAVEYQKPFEYYEGDEVEMYDTNGVHPSTAGYKQLGTCAAAFIQAKR